MERINTVGRRKASVARVFLDKGTGKIIVNGKDHKEYFPLAHLSLMVEKPLRTIELTGDYDFTINVKGGGIKGQAEAITLGIARALVVANADFKPLLKAESLMTRDARVVERKKPGLRKARKSDQFSKR